MEKDNLFTQASFETKLFVFRGSRFTRKDATFSTGDFIQAWLTRTDTVPAGAGIIKQVFYGVTLTK